MLLLSLIHISTYEVTLSANEEGGTILTAGAKDLKMVPYGTDLFVVDNPKEGYELTALTANETDILATKKVFITGHTLIKATFNKKPKTYKVTLKPTEHGTISIKEQELSLIHIFIVTLVTMLLLLAGSSVSAQEEYGLQIAGVAVTSENCSDLTAIPGVKGKVSYDPTTKTLTLEDASIDGGQRQGIGAKGELTCVVKGEVSITSNKHAVVFFNNAIIKRCV